MGILKLLGELFKGGGHARRAEEHISRGNGRERRVIHSLPALRERTISDIRGIRVLASACSDERSRDSGEMPSDPIRRESRALIAAAKKVGCFVDAAAVPGSRYTIRTGESEVRMVQLEQVYYKIKNPFAKTHLKKHPIEYALFEHVVHNILFPDCRLEFIGVAEDMREARIVYRQNAVCSDTRPDDRQIEERLWEMGLRRNGRYSFGNDFLFVTDVGQDSDNVLLDDDGNLRFIDPIIGFERPLLGLLSSAIESESKVSEILSSIYSLSQEERESLSAIEL